jgi:predicted cupin superfamily sugar epimerase
MRATKQWIDGLRLERHPQGGCYRETSRAAERRATVVDLPGPEGRLPQPVRVPGGAREVEVKTASCR